MPSLKQIAERTGTDKLGHGYIELYEKYFPVACRTFLEIGVERGKSALMWDEYYGHDEIELHLIDLFINPEFVSARWCQNKGFFVHKGDQSDIEFLYTIKGSFQCIVDDGSHSASHMMISWKHLFVNNCASGSVYAIEDVFTNHNEFYRGDIASFEDTPLGFFKRFMETGRVVHPYFSQSEADTFEQIIGDVVITEGEKIIFITRK